ncbi:MAG: hypothetical protein U9N80_00755 [Chloroflexota bacterium]|nr:hypothetical protein [Chloroflexota bacterium]
MEVSEANIRRMNASWIEAVENALAAHGDVALTKEVMKAAGQKCAQQIIDDCSEIIGRRPANIDELLEATNKRRLQLHGLDNLWEVQGNKAHLKIDKCGCTLVKAGLARISPVHCLCSIGLMEKLFSAVCTGPVVVEVVKAIGFGDETCEFYVDFVA